MVRRIIAVLFAAGSLAGVFAPLGSADSVNGCNGHGGVLTAFESPGQGEHAADHGAPQGCEP
jgi:hypothetical protein